MKNRIFIMMMSVMAFTFSCSEFEKFELPESGSIADETPPSASFSSFPEEGFEEQFRNYTFSNTSTSATIYAWDFGDGSTSVAFEPTHTFAAEGTYTVSLTATDALGVFDTTIQEIEVIRPEPPAVLDPVLVNTEFDRIAKLGSSNTCACSGWDNDDIGEQGESSSQSGVDFVKFDNAEPDHIYQEFEVVPNADYLITVITKFSNPAGSTSPTSYLDLRVLAGTGYISGYTPVYYETAPEYPKNGYGYTTVAQLENSANNLLEQTITTPGNDDLVTSTYGFNSGANTSVALFVRGLGGGTGGSYGYNNGAEEILMDSVNITANN